VRHLTCANSIPVTAELLTRERLLEASAIAPLTCYGYRSDWKNFTAWCQDHELQALPADERTVANYFVDRLNHGYKINTVARHLSAIRYYHLRDSLPCPCTEAVHRMLLGAKRLRCDRLDQRAPLMPDDLRRIMAVCVTDTRPVMMRNRAILLFGFATALRRSSLCFLDVADLQRSSNGLLVAIRREKQDQFGEGRSVAVPFGKTKDTCPVSALESWLAVRGNAAGPLFTQAIGRGYSVGLERMAPQAICRIVKDCVQRAGLDPAPYGAHSLRAGFVTAAGEAGAGELLIAAQTGHRTMAVLRRYFRRSDLFRANACAALDL
jgi:integrase